MPALTIPIHKYSDNSNPRSIAMQSLSHSAVFGPDPNPINSHADMHGGWFMPPLPPLGTQSLRRLRVPHLMPWLNNINYDFSAAAI